MDAGKPFEFERQSGYSRLTLQPELNAFRWEDIEKSAAGILGELDASKPPALIVDLSPLDYLGSAQVTLLVRIWKGVKAYTGRMVVLAPAPVVREVLNTAGLNALWEFADTRQEALEVLDLQSDGRPRLATIWTIVGLVALAVAVGFLGVSFWRAHAIHPTVSLAVQLGCLAVALGFGLWTAIGATGLRRGVGVGLVVASAVLAIAGVLNHARPRVAVETSEEETEEESTAEEQSGEAPAGDAKPDAAADKTTPELPKINPETLKAIPGLPGTIPELPKGGAKGN
ncbi:MAG: STAS domain-containing protein [Planctomycetaceae bacterium]